MYPASFEYFAPTTLDEAVSTLAQFGDEAKVLAGGQSLIPLMKLRIAAPRALVDIGRVEGLDGLEEQDGRLSIGALVTHRTCERADVLQGRFGVLGATAPLVSDPIVRNRGTVCGSVVHADPQGDWSSALLALGAEVVARGPDGERTIPLEEFSQGPFMTALQPTEIVTSIRAADPGPRAGGSYHKLERRIGDYATVGVAVHVSLDNGTIGRAGIALAGVGATNVKAVEAESALAGAAPDDEAIAEAARLAAEAGEPMDDVRGTAEYKRNLVRIFTERGLRQAIAAAQG